MRAATILKNRLVALALGLVLLLVIPALASARSAATTFEGTYVESQGDTSQPKESRSLDLS